VTLLIVANLMALTLQTPHRFCSSTSDTGLIKNQNQVGSIIRKKINRENKRFKEQ
jgi:hypothetical protein